jgi:hypothetical protein
VRHSLETVLVGPNRTFVPFRTLWLNETCRLKAFGSFLGSFYTGEMRTPLDSKQVLLFDLEIWFLLLLLVK